MQHGELFALQGPVIANRNTAGQEWVDDEGRSPDKEHCLLVLTGTCGACVACGFLLFPVKIRNFPTESLRSLKHHQQEDNE